MTSFIVAACRTPVAPRGGAFAALEIHELAAPVIQAALDRAGLETATVDELVLSNALGAGGNPARVAALAAGLPQSVAGLSIDRQCAGGLDALLLADAMINSGAAEIVIAGGAESYSRRPHRLRSFPDGRPAEAYDRPRFTPFPDRDPNMAEAADALALELSISRSQQDLWAVESHRKALRAKSSQDEIISLASLDRDAFARDLTPALCARAKQIAGSITAANTAVAADAAAFCVVVSAQVAEQLTTAAIEIVGGATRGAAPERPGLAPVAAINAALQKTALKVNNIAVAEVMEAYAVQAIACVSESGLNPAIVNRGGGALARGHPIGASGAINAVRLFHEMRQTGGIGLAAIAAAGGIGTALILRAG